MRLKKDAIKLLIELVNSNNDAIFLRNGFRDKNGRRLTMQALMRSAKAVIKTESDPFNWIQKFSNYLKNGATEINKELELNTFSDKKLNKTKIKKLVSNQLAGCAAICSILDMTSKEIFKLNKKYPS